MGRSMFRVRSLLFYQYEPSSPAEWFEGEGVILCEKIRHQGVSTVVIITGEAVPADEYPAFTEFFKRQGFRVRSIHIERLNRAAPGGMKKIAREIAGAVTESTSCLVVSYGKSLALMVIACYLIYSGDSPSSAIRHIKNHIPSFPFNADNAVFLYAFSRYLHESSAAERGGGATPFPLSDCPNGIVQSSPLQIEKI